MKDARGATHSLAESGVPFPARHGLIELIGQTAAQVQPLLINAVASRGGGNGSGQGGSTDRRETEPRHARAVFIGAAQAASLNDSPLLSTAQAMRAFFAAMATTAFQYARCCRTPIGNTPRNLKVAHIGLVHACLEACGASLDDSFGPVRMRVNTQSTGGKAPSNSPLTFGWAVARYLTSMAWSRITAGYKDNPFFNPATGQPIVHPHVVSRAERAALRGDA